MTGAADPHRVLRGAVRTLAALALVLGIAAVIASCRPPAFLVGRRVTGTCEGACDHYLECKGGGSTDACVADCREVFSDPESLRAFESLSCADTVEYVEGPRAARADR